MINLIVATSTAIGAGFLLFWIVRPSFRVWMEMPKYKMLEQERRFRGAEVNDFD